MGDMGTPQVKQYFYNLYVQILDTILFLPEVESPFHPEHAKQEKPLFHYRNFLRLQDVKLVLEWRSRQYDPATGRVLPGRACVEPGLLVEEPGPLRYLLPNMWLVDGLCVTSVTAPALPDVDTQGIYGLDADLTADLIRPAVVDPVVARFITMQREDKR